MNECPAPPDAHLGLADRIAAWLFPGFCADIPEAGRLVIGPCDRMSAKAEAEAEAEP